MLMKSYISCLVQQQFTLSKLQAHEVFYGMVVNTKGHIDSHISVDLQMEHIVRSMKKHIKHMFANKTEENITKQTGALTMINDIYHNADKQSSHGDEVTMVQLLIFQ